MDVNDIIVGNVFDYISHDIIEYDEMYNKICNEVAGFIENNLLTMELTMDVNHVKQFVGHYLIKELNFNEYIRIQKEIIEDDKSDEFLDGYTKGYNINVSKNAIEIYSNFNQEQMIIDIINKINFNTKRKSR